jgi:hypothetical protein
MPISEVEPMIEAYPKQYWAESHSAIDRYSHARSKIPICRPSPSGGITALNRSRVRRLAPHRVKSPVLTVRRSLPAQLDERTSTVYATSAVGQKRRFDPLPLTSGLTR